MVVAALPLFLSAQAAGDAPKLGDAIATKVGRAGGLTADDVARRAVLSSFDLRARRAQVAAAAANAEAAFASYFPRLSLLARYTRLSPIGLPSLSALLPPPLNMTNLSFPVFLNNTVFQAQLAIPISDYVLRLSQNHRAATISQKAAQLGEHAARYKVAQDARVAYYAWSRAKLQVIVAEQAREQARGHLGDVRRLVEAGSASRADLLRVESQVANADLLVVRATELAQLLEEQLRIAMHEAGKPSYEIGEDLRANLPPLPHAHDLAALQREALDRRLELRSVAETVASLREQVKVVDAGLYPRLDALLEGQMSNPNPRFIPQVDEFKGTFAAAIQLSWSPNDLLTTRAQSRQLESKVHEVVAQRAGLEDGIRAEVAAALRSVRESTAAIATTERSLVAAEEAYRVRRELYRHGRSTVVEVTDAETELTRSRLEAVGARVDQRIARARLVHAVGRDLDTPIATDIPNLPATKDASK
jgi:outer membrane protein TolC